MRILDRYVWKEPGPPFGIGVFFLFIDRFYQLTNLVITKNVPFHLVFPLLLLMLPAFFRPRGRAVPERAHLRVVRCPGACGDSLLRVR